MAVTTRLSRYKALAAFVTKYSRTDFSRTPDGDRDDQEVQSVAFARDLEALGPTFIKLGQLLSTRSDLLPQPYVDALARLQDDVEPFDGVEVEQIIEQELHVRLSKAFSRFDRQPIAAASLGQVHCAALRDGRPVAVKVQRPDVRDRVLEDLEALDDVAALLERFTGAGRRLEVSRVLEEFRRAMMSELDYRQEAINLRTCAHQLRHYENILVPLPIDDYSTERVLTMDFIGGTKITAVSPVTWTEVDGARLADDLFRADQQQLHVDGVFHADPHPGNVLLTSDHRIALLDLGMVGRLSSRLQEQLLKLLLAVADAHADEAATIAIALGEAREDFDEPAMRRDIVDMVSRYQQATLGELNAGRLMLEMARNGQQHGLRMPPDLALLGKTLLNLDEIGRVLDPQFDVNGSIRRHAATVMRRRMLTAVTPAKVFSSLIDVREFAERLPGRVNRILDALAGNDLRLKVEVIDHGSIIDGLQKVANRIALGLVLAAMIIGAAMLMRVPTTFTILGYPGLAIVLFLAAAGGGLWMVWTILGGDVRRTRIR